MNASGGPSSVDLAVEALRLEARVPTDDDRPPPSVFPGPVEQALPGQLAFEWCPHCGDALDSFGKCPREGTPPHLTARGLTLR